MPGLPPRASNPCSAVASAFIAPTGQDMTAQGRAKRRPGVLPVAHAMTRGSLAQDRQQAGLDKAAASRRIQSGFAAGSCTFSHTMQDFLTILGLQEPMHAPKGRPRLAQGKRSAALGKSAPNVGALKGRDKGVGLHALSRNSAGCRTLSGHGGLGPA